MKNTKQGAVRRSSRIKSSAFSGDVIVKRMTIPSLLIPVNGAFVIPVTTFDSTLVQSTPATEFASFAARYQQYRVRSMTLVTKAIHPTTDTLMINHSTMYVSDFIGTSAPTSGAQVLADERAKQFSTARDWSFSVSWDRNPNAKLWNPTSAVIPAANSYGVALCSNPALPLSTVAIDVFSLAILFEIELRGSQ
jgi:hypothetical protein